MSFNHGETTADIIMNLEPGTFYLVCNGKIVNQQTLSIMPTGLPVHIIPRVLGGKGGFGSMLRAIGAQIEKTTNRDACRDLSGRRLRDINEEQRLKRWFAKQKQRDEERAELKKQKLEKLRQICDGPPLPKMEDKEYNRVRAEMSDAIFEAVEKGFEAPSTSKSKSGNCTVTSASASSTSTSSEDDEDAKQAEEKPHDVNDGRIESSTVPKPVPSKEVKRKMPALKKTMLDEDLDSDVSSSDSEDDDSKSTPAKKIKI